MPPQGIELRPHDELLSYEELERLARLFAGMGIHKIRLTGGEPLCQGGGSPEFVRVLCGISGIDFVGLTTNAVRLAIHARELRDAGAEWAEYFTRQPEAPSAIRH